MKNILGFTDEITTCSCCGRTNLKGTYSIEVYGIVNYYGSTCAFKDFGFSKKELNKAVKTAYLIELDKRQTAFRARLDSLPVF